MKGSAWVVVLLVSGVCGAAAGYVAGRLAVPVAPSHGAAGALVATDAPEAAPAVRSVDPQPGQGAASLAPSAEGSSVAATQAPAAPAPTGDGPPPPEGLQRQEPSVVKIPQPWEVGPAIGPTGGPGAPAPNP